VHFGFCFVFLRLGSEGGAAATVLEDTRCDAAHGACKLEAECGSPDYTRAGLCPGPTGVKCCISAAATSIVGGSGSAVAAVNLTPFLNGYLRLGETSADAAVAKLVATVNAFADAKEAEHARAPWHMERILAGNLRRAVPRVATWAAARTREAFTKLKSMLQLPQANYYLTVEEPRLEHFDLADVVLAQEGRGFKFTASAAFQGRFDIVVRRETPPPRQEFMRFTVYLERPLSFRIEARVGVTGAEGRGTPNVAVSFAFGAGTDAALNLRLAGEVSVGTDGFAAVGVKFSEMRAKLLELARGAHRWHGATREGGWKALFGKLDAEVRDVASAVESFVHTEKDLGTKTFGEIVSSARLVAIRDRIVRSALPQVEAAIRTALAADAARPALAFLARGAPSTENERLHVTLKRALMNRPFLLSDFGARLQAVIVRHFLVDVSGIALAQYKWQQKEKAMGGPLPTLDLCAAAQCRASGQPAHMCGRDNLLNFKAINTLMYRSVNAQAIPSGRSRRVCYQASVIPNVLTPGTNLGNLPNYCCSVVSAGTGGAPPRVTVQGGSCSTVQCTGETPEPPITSLAITYGDNSARALTDIDARRCRARNAARGDGVWRDCPGHRMVAFGAGRSGGDIAGNRWWAKRTKLWAETAPRNGGESGALKEVGFAWLDQREGCPAGWNRVEKAVGNREDGSLTQGPGTRSHGFKRLYMCVQYGAMEPRSITHAQLVYGNRRAASPGYEVLRRSVSGRHSANFNFGRWDDDDEAVFLAVRRVSASGLPTMLDPVIRYGKRDEHWSDAENVRGGSAAAAAAAGGTSTSSAAPNQSLRPRARPRIVSLLQLDSASQAKARVRSRAQSAELDQAHVRVHTQALTQVHTQALTQVHTQAQAHANTAVAVANPPATQYSLIFEIGAGSTRSRLFLHSIALEHVAVRKFKALFVEDLVPASETQPDSLPGLRVEFSVAGKLTAHAVLEGKGGLARSIGTWGRSAQDHDQRLTAGQFPNLASDNIMYNTMDARHADGDENPEPAHGELDLSGTLEIHFDPASRKWRGRVAKLEVHKLDLNTKNERSGWIVRGTLGIAEILAGSLERVVPWVTKLIDDVAADLGVGDQFGDEFARLPGSNARFEIDLSFNAPQRLFADKVIEPIYTLLHGALLSGGLDIGQEYASRE
jgi:hypothetical protein